MNHNKDILLYDRPAKTWLDSMPIGNGRLGAMITGDIEKEIIFLDEESIWAGCPTDNNRPHAHHDIPPLREMIFNNRYDHAKQFAQDHCTGFDKNFGTHLRAGALIINYHHAHAAASSYQRQLDMANAISTVSYSTQKAHYTRQALATYVDDVICVQLTADKPAAVNITLSLATDRQNPGMSIQDNMLRLDANCRDNGVHFQIAVGVQLTGGSLSAHDNKLIIKDADSVTLLVDINSSYQDKNYTQINDLHIKNALQKDTELIFKHHMQDFSALYRRVDFELQGQNLSHLTIDKRLEALQAGQSDLDLITKFFQFGRYLLISSSRPGTLAAHLQGIWNDDKAANMGWTCDYHLDINTQMNYWPAESCHLSDCHAPVVNFIESLREPGRTTAKIHYNCPGWVAHATTNLWGHTSPGHSERWGFFPTGGLWMALHLADHYNFTGDKAFLEKTAYPILKESAEFFQAFIVEHPQTGYWVTCPATSEENVFETPDGQQASVCAGPTCDNVLLKELFDFCIQASETLDRDKDLRTKWKNIISRLVPLKIGKHGQIQEWFDDFDEPEPQHRHVSHLLSAYPFFQITPEQTPTLSAAAAETINRKMRLKTWEAVGWNRAWNINIFARLGQADLALENLIGLLNITQSSLLTYHPPFGGAQENIFEMDGNTGGTAGIAEMLVQSHNNTIKLLPALPHQWHRGHIKGLQARGGFDIDIEWHDGVLTKAVIKSKNGNHCCVLYQGQRNEFSTEKNRQYILTVNDFGIS